MHVNYVCLLTESDCFDFHKIRLGHVHNYIQSYKIRLKVSNRRMSSQKEIQSISGISQLVRWLAGRVIFTGLHDGERAVQFLIDSEHSARIVHLAAIVGRREYGYQIAMSKELITILDHLVGATDQIEIVTTEKLPNNHLRIGNANATVIDAPAVATMIQIGPEQIAQQSGAGHIRWPRQVAYPLHAIQIGRQAAVAAKDAIVNDSGNGQIIEAIHKAVPQLDAIATLHLIKESCGLHIYR